MEYKEEGKIKLDFVGERRNFSLLLETKESGGHTVCGHMS